MGIVWGSSIEFPNEGSQICRFYYWSNITHHMQIVSLTTGASLSFFLMHFVLLRVILLIHICIYCESYVLLYSFPEGGGVVFSGEYA